MTFVTECGGGGPFSLDVEVTVATGTEVTATIQGCA